LIEAPAPYGRKVADVGVIIRFIFIMVLLHKIPEVPMSCLVRKFVGSIAVATIVLAIQPAASAEIIWKYDFNEFDVSDTIGTLERFVTLQPSEVGIG
jgi:hypothetical protein